MKNNFFVVFLFVFIFFQSCATTNIEKTDNNLQENSSAQNKNKKSNKKSDAIYIEENAQNSEKLRFSDWKYKGFGKDLPVWIDFVFDDNLKSLYQNYDEFSKETEFVVIKGFGKNSDQAEDSAKLKLEEFKQNNNDFEKKFTLFEHFWVKLDFENIINIENFLTSLNNLTYLYIYFIVFKANKSWQELKGRRRLLLK